MRTKRLMSAVPLVAVCVLAGACSGGAGGPGGATGSAAPSGPTYADVDVNPRQANAVKDGGTLRFAIDQWVPQWNQLQVDGALQVANEPESAIFPRMYRSDAHGNVRPNPDYLTDASITKKKPHQVVTYKIRPKAKWSDGKPITWKDFAAQWRAARGTNSRYQVASTSGYERISDVKKGSGDRTVIVTFDKPFGEWLKLFDPLYPAAYTSDPNRFNNAYRGRIPVTAGPFKAGKIDKTAQTVTVVRDPKWWGARPKLDSIVFRAMADNAIPGAFANGEIDYALIGADAAAYRQASGVKGGQVRKAAGPDYRTLTFGRSGPLKDARLRQAVAMGINRQAIANADLQGLDWPTRTMDNHIFVNTQAGYRSNAGKTGTFDQAKARTALDGLGWKPGPGGVRTKGGKRLSIRMVIPSGTPASKNEADLVQTMLKQIGVAVDVRSVSSNDFFDSYVTPGKFDIAPFSWIGTPFPISEAKPIYGTPKGGTPQQNFGGIGSAKADKLMDTAQSKLNVQEARADMNTADTVIWNVAHSLVLYQRPQYTAVKANLANIGSWGMQTPDFTVIGYTK